MFYRCFLMFIICAFGCGSAQAATVLWDAVIDDFYAPVEGELEITCFIDGCFMLDIELASTLQSSNEVVIKGIGACLGASENIIVAHPGDIASSASTRHLARESYFSHAFIDDEDYYGNNTAIAAPDSSLYMMFVFSDDIMYRPDPSYIYGWVEIVITADGTLSLGRSAIDLDGGPMIVGGGAWEGGTPEPASGLLLLVGASLLALRRDLSGRKKARA